MSEHSKHGAGIECESFGALMTREEIVDAGISGVCEWCGNEVDPELL